MTTILGDLATQLACLAFVAAIPIALLVLGAIIHDAIDEWRSVNREVRLAERLDRDQRVNRYESIVRDVIAERRR